MQMFPVTNMLLELLEKEHVGLGKDVVMDDRDERIGGKLADTELVGNPIIITLGNRWRASGSVEIRNFISASHSEISLLPSSSEQPDQLDLLPVMLHVTAEIHKLTPRVS
jgi:hypothetical protein